MSDRDAWTDHLTKQQQANSFKANKYGAKRKLVDGVLFDSTREARRYCELKLMEKAGQIRNLALQYKYPLVVHHRKISERGKVTCVSIHVGFYRADFRYEERGLSASENERWNVVVEDVKGVRTPVYRLKKKMVEAQYGITIHEV